MRVRRLLGYAAVALVAAASAVLPATPALAAQSCGASVTFTPLQSQACVEPVTGAVNYFFTTTNHGSSTVTVTLQLRTAINGIVQPICDGGGSYTISPFNSVVLRCQSGRVSGWTFQARGTLISGNVARSVKSPVVGG